MTQQVKWIDCKKFIAAALVPDKEIFEVHIAYLKVKMSINSAHKTQIILLLSNQVSVLKKYINFLDVFIQELIKTFSDSMNKNEYTIDLESGKQFFYRLI